MGNRNQLICWEENSIKKWDMIEEQDSNTFLMNLLQNSDVDKHTMREILKLLIRASVRESGSSISEAIGKLSTLISILSTTEEE